MDSYREHPSDFELPVASETSAAADVAAAIGTDERRMHVRAYNYWASLLEGRDFPSIEDLEPGDVKDFAGNSVLLDFTCGRDNPAIPYIGATIRDECGLDDDMRTIAQVPSRSLLSRLTDHYMQIIANRAPVGFEAEFENQRGENICYRGILMPFSSDGEAIDFIYGVMNWKKGAETAKPPHFEAAPPEIQGISDDLPDVTPIETVLELSHGVPEPAPQGADGHLTWEDGPSAEPEVEPGGEREEAPAPVHFAWEDGPLADADEVPIIELDEHAGLADRLWAARETADAVKAGEGRTRAALYKALSLAYDFAIAAQQNPEDYAELLAESGMKAQARAPMTPIAKLVFGIEYDKARLTEFAAALSYAQREEIELGGFKQFIEKQPGGLKGLVAAERQARRPGPKPDTQGEAARAKLRSAAPISLAEVSSDEEFAVVVTRRTADGRHEPVAIVDDEALIERAIRRAA
jgi:hypothetical protein